MSAEERFGLETLICKSSAHNTDVVFTVMKWMSFSLMFWRTRTEEKRRLKTQNIEVRKRRWSLSRRPKNSPRGGSK